jgi:HlyD family secretion protein
VEGRSTIISLIPEGTAVQKGDLLVELASADIEDRIRQEELKESNAITEYEAAKTDLDIQREKNASDVRKANLEIELKTLELRKYQEGEWAQKLKDADIAIEQAQMTLERREQDYSASKELFAKNYTTQTEHEEAEFNFRKAQWDLEKARMAKDVLQQYTHVADLKQRESDLHEATQEFERVKKNAEAEETRKLRNTEGKGKELGLIRDQLAKLRTQKEKCKIYAPTQGFVVYYSGGGGRRWMMEDQQIKEGAEVFERQILMQLPDTSVMNAVVRVHEAKTDKLREGQSATVTVEGIPGRQFTGKVTKIAVLADSQSSWLNPDLKEYETEITLDPTEVALKPGVTAHAEILVETVTDELAIPIQSVYAKGGQRYVFRADGSEVKHAPVELGNIGTEWAEVVSGLSEGDSILLAFGEDLKRRIPDVGNGESGSNGAGGQSLEGKRRGPGRRAGGPQGVQRAGGLPGGKPGEQRGERPQSARGESGEKPKAVDSAVPAQPADASARPSEAKTGTESATTTSPPTSSGTSP